MSSIACDVCSKIVSPAEKFSILDKNFCTLLCLKQYKKDNPERFTDKFATKPGSHINTSGGWGGKAY